MEIRKVDFVPSICKGTEEKEAEYSGHLILKLPHVKEKIAMMRSFKLKLNKDNEIEQSEDPADIMDAMIEICEKMILESHLKRSDESEISVDDLFYDSDLTPVLMEVGSAILNKLRPSKKL